MQKDQLKKDIAPDTERSEKFINKLPASEQLALRWVLERAKIKQSGSNALSRAFNSVSYAELRFGHPGRELAWIEEPN